MIKQTAINKFLTCRGEKYIKPEKAGNLKVVMETMKREGQSARLAFADLAKAFQAANPQFQLDRVSNWANQAQVCRPHFWVYFAEDITVSAPMYALRVFGESGNFGISVEVSIIERKRDEHSLIRQSRILDVPVVTGTYYQYLQDDKTIRLGATEENRLWLREQVRIGAIRKVLIKVDVPWELEQEEATVISNLSQATQLLLPFYQETQKNS